MVTEECLYYYYYYYGVKRDIRNRRIKDIRMALGNLLGIRKCLIRFYTIIYMTLYIIYFLDWMKIVVLLHVPHDQNYIFELLFFIYLFLIWALHSDFKSIFFLYKCLIMGEQTANEQTPMVSIIIVVCVKGHI